MDNILANNEKNVKLLSFIPRCMQWRCCLAMRKLSVCLSVRQTRDLWQKGRKMCQDFFIQYERTFTLVFWEEEWLERATHST